MTSGQDGTSFFMNRQEGGFGPTSEDDDRMHGDAGAEHPGAADLIETQYLPFNVPSAGINSFNYTWVHPNLGVASGGVWAYQGIKPTHLHSELFDMREFLPISSVGDLTDFRLDNGYAVEVRKPLEELRISYEDAARGNAFDVTLTAIMPPAMLPSGRHFEQAMRTRGTVTLLGTTHTVDGFHVRDRSWGETRPEAPRRAPVLHWVTPVFTEDFALQAMGFEDPTRGALWSGLYDVGPEEVADFNRGWVWRSGELVALDDVVISCEWDPVLRFPRSYLIEATDRNGRGFRLTGELVAGSPRSLWSNIYSPILMFRWECEDKVGHGDAQLGIWTDTVRERLP